MFSLKFKLLAAFVLLGFGSTIFFGFKMSYDSAIRNEALANFNKQQLEQVLKDAEKLKADMAALAQAAKYMQEELNRKNIETDKLAEQIVGELSKMQGNDKQSSQILRETIKRLPELSR